MGKINLCIAMSLDGYIADAAGKVDFLFEKKRVEPDEDYAEFYRNVDLIMFGSRTYKQIVDEISPEKRLYGDKRCVVFSKQADRLQHSNRFLYLDSLLHSDDAELPLEFTSLPPAQYVDEVVRSLKGEAWLFGGRSLIRSFMEEDLIDKYWIYIVPVILGEGVPLFTPASRKLPLKLVKISKVDDMVKIFYERSPEQAGV
jgi:dihydrofolate reductase